MRTLQIYHECLLELKDGLISFWWSKVRLITQDVFLVITQESMQKFTHMVHI